MRIRAPVSELWVAILSGFLLAALAHAPTHAGWFANGGSGVTDEAQDQYAVAAGHFRAKRWRLAAVEYREFLRRWGRHPNASRARFYLGEAEMELRRYQQARATLRELAAAEPAFPYIARVRFRIGQASWRLGDDKAASKELSEFLRRHPNDPLGELALPYLADAHLALQQFKLARDRYEEALKAFPQGRLAEDARYGLARALEQTGEVQRAIHLYRALAENTASDLADDARLNLGARLFEQKQFREAADVLDRFEERFPESDLISAAALNEGWARYQLDEFAEAAAIFEHLSENPKFAPEASYWQGLSYKAAGRSQDAVRVLLAAASRYDDHRLTPHMEFHAAEAMAQQGQHQQAAERFLRVARQWPKADIADESLFHACQTHFRLKQYRRQRQLTELIADAYPDSPLVIPAGVLLGQAYVDAGDYGKAVDLLRRLLAKLKRDSDDTDARYALGIAYQQLGRHDEAIDVWKPLEQRAGSDARVAAVPFHMAVSQSAIEQYDEAARRFEQFLKTAQDGDPNTARAVADLAICYAHLKQDDAADALWQRLVQHHSGNPVTVPATLQIAEIAYARKDLARAEARFLWVVDNDRDPTYRAKALSGLGWTRFDRGEYGRAADALKELLDGYPDDPAAPEAALLRAQALRADSHNDRALAAYALLIDRYSQSPEAPIAALQRARLLRQSNQWRDAAAAYDLLFEKYPTIEHADQAAYERAWVYLDLGDEQKANGLFLELAEQFPKSTLAADALLNVAEARYAAKQYAPAGALLDQAQRTLNAIVDSANRRRLQESIWYRRGRMAADQQDWQAIREPLSRLLEGYPESRFASEAQFWLAEADYQQGDTAAAEIRFKTLLESPGIAGEAWVGTAWLRRAQALAKRKQWQEALHAVEVLKKRFPNYELTYEADYLQGRCLSSFAPPKFDQARSAFRRCIASSNGKKTETAAQAQFMIGETYFHQRNYKRALREYLRVELLYDYPLWQAAALLEAGQCSEQLAAAESAPDRQALHWNQAAEFYQRIVDHEPYAKTEFAPQAKGRLAQIRQTIESSK